MSYRQIEHEEIIAIHYSDYEQFSESEERLSQSSSDVTPQNSPRPSLIGEPRLIREKIPYNNNNNIEFDLSENFSSLLHITPMTVKSPSVKKRQNSSILKSEISSSKWIRNRPESSVNCDRNSAKSYMSLDTRNCNNSVLSVNERNVFNNRVLTARQREIKRLEPLHTPEVNHYDRHNSLNHGYNNRKVSLPPLTIEEEKKSSAKRFLVSKRRSKCYHQVDKR